MSRFNKHLSQLEAIYEVATPVMKSADPVHVSDFIHYIFENTDTYDITGLDKDWFCAYTSINESKSVNFINNLLQGQGHLVTKESILEGINHFVKDESNG
jgi:hypothetical protein